MIAVQRPRVVVTGMGIVSPIGNDVATFRASLRAGRAGIGSRDATEEGWPEGTALLAAGVGNAHAPSPAERVNLDPFAQFAVRAAREAIEAAGVAWVREHAERTAIVLGAASGGERSRDAASFRVHGAGKSPHPLTIVRSMLSQSVSAVSIEHGITGPAFAVSSACASAAHAIAQATRLLQVGMADVAIAGGSEALPSYSAYRAWKLLKVLSPDGCRPFSADRNGLVFGEGAGVLVLERLDDAVARGATLYGEIAGVGMSSDAASWVNPDPAGLARCMAGALADAAVSAADIAYVNAHATGTERGDAAEAEAIARVFACNAEVAVSSTKCLHGHVLGGAGAIEAIVTLLALGDRFVPAQCTPADPALSINVIAERGMLLDGHLAMSNSFGFGGVNASLVFRRVE